MLDSSFGWVLAEFARREPRYLGALRRVAVDLSTQVLRTPVVAPESRLYDYDVLSGTAGQLVGVLVVADAVASVGDDDLCAGLRAAAERLVAHLMAVTGLDAAVPSGSSGPRRTRRLGAAWRDSRMGSTTSAPPTA
jgi:hypothetical protein